jgi:hypothetical protein
MISVVVLFVHILGAPKANSATGDIALLNIAAGHFARLELLSDFQISFSMARTMADICRDTRLAIPISSNAPRDPRLDEGTQYISSSPAIDPVSLPYQVNHWHITDMKKYAADTSIDLDLDCWNVFRPDFDLDGPEL